MVRNSERKTQDKYDCNLLPELAQMVHDEGYSVTSLAKEYLVPKTTLLRWVNTTPKRIGSGGLTVLTKDEENIIVAALNFCGKCGYPQGREQVKDMVQSFIISVGRRNPFTDNRPGEDWMRMTLFEKRHKEEIKRRKPELLTKARSEGFSA